MQEHVRTRFKVTKTFEPACLLIHVSFNMAQYGWIYIQILGQRGKIVKLKDICIFLLGIA